MARIFPLRLSHRAASVVAVAGTAAAVVGPVLFVLVGFEVADDVALIHQVLESAETVRFPDTIWAHVGYGLIAAFLLVIGLTAALETLLSRSNPQEPLFDAPPRLDSPANTGPSPASNSDLASALRALQTVQAEIGRRGSRAFLGEHELAGILERARARIVEELAPTGEAVRLTGAPRE
jgi:hypothetical protein